MKTKLNTLTKSLIITGVIGGISLPVAANKYRDYNNSAYDHAKVVGVDPIFETYQVNDPVEECWDEKIPKKAHYRNDRRHGGSNYSRTPEILGGLIGAVLGNQVGNGRGKKVATVAGAVLGASVGRDVKHRNRDRNYRDHRSERRGDYDRGGYQNSRYEVVQRCELRDNYTTKQRVVAYNVAYKYRGNVFHTEMQYEPSDEIKVKVTVNPV